MPVQQKTNVAPSVQGQPLHLQLLAYATQTSGATYQEMAVNFQANLRSVRRAVRHLRRHRLVRCKLAHGRVEVTSAHPAVWSPQPESARVLHCADLFCGAGGLSSGLAQAVQQLGRDLQRDVDLVAINHSPEAIESHQRNHPWARHCLEDIAKAQPRKLFPGGKVHILLAAPSCTHFSGARGAAPVNDQLRTHAWQVVRWARDLDVDCILVENVKEFRSWGPVKNGKPVKDGSIFRRWIRELRLLGYTIDHDGTAAGRIFNAADYGDATSRRRFFLIAVKNGRSIVLPKQTHSRADAQGRPTVPGTLPWRGAREIIDPQLAGQSVRFRKRPLVIKTRQRIVKGIRRFWGPAFEPLAQAILNGSQEPVRIPVRDFLKHGLVPFMLQQQSGGEPRNVQQPTPSIATGGAISIIEPQLDGFVVEPGQRQNSSPAHAGHEPLGTVVGKDRHAWVDVDLAPGAPDLVLDQYGGQDTEPSRVAPAAEPLGAILGSQRFGVLNPVLVGTGGPSGQGEPRTSQQPLPAVLAQNRLAVVDPSLVLPPLGYYARGGDANPAHPPSDPLCTITAGRGGDIGLVKARLFLLKLRGTSSVADAAQPLPTATAGGNHLGVVEPESFMITTDRPATNRTLPRPLSEPMFTAVAQQARVALVDALVLATGGRQASTQARDGADPLFAVLPNNRLNVLSPFLYPHFGERLGQEPRTHDVGQPLPTLATLGQGRVVDALVTDYHSNGGTRPVTEPLPTQDTRDRFAILTPVFEGDVLVDATLRMFKWYELAAAMGFPPDFEFVGSDQVKIRLIGNAVAVRLAKALVLSLLQGRSVTLDDFAAPQAPSFPGNLGPVAEPIGAA